MATISPDYSRWGRVRPSVAVIRVAPENGSRSLATDGRGHLRFNRTPALTGIPLARPEGLEPPTF